MQISITNGTLTSISETLQPQANYDLPTTISVSGATSSYNSTTGEVSLSSITSSVSITASGVFNPVSSFGETELTAGDGFVALEVNGVTYGLTLASN